MKIAQGGWLNREYHYDSISAQAMSTPWEWLTGYHVRAGKWLRGTLQ
jgi:hypothetical protein